MIENKSITIKDLMEKYEEIEENLEIKNKKLEQKLRQNEIALDQYKSSLLEKEKTLISLTDDNDKIKVRFSKGVARI